MFRQIIISLIALLTLTSFLSVATGVNKVILAENCCTEETSATTLVDIPLEDQLEPQILNFSFHGIFIPNSLVSRIPVFLSGNFLLLSTPPPEN